MKLNYYPETDSLYIHLNDRPSVESEEVAPGIVLDFDEHNAVVGIEIERAGESVDLAALESLSLPFKASRGAAKLVGTSGLAARTMRGTAK